MSLGFIYELTGRCNLDCVFCYNAWDERPEGLGAREVCALLDRVLAESAATWLTFTGGEPLLHEGLEQILDHVHRRFPAVQLGLATNGVLLEESRLQRLLAAGLRYVELSLFACEDADYARLTGRPCRELPLRALALARAWRLPVTVATVLHAGLEERLEDLLRMAFALGADRVALNRFALRRGRRELLPTLEQLHHMLALADRLGRELALPVAVTTPIEDCLLPHAQYPHLAFAPCVCGDRKWAIDPLGRLRTCELSEVVLGDLQERSFTELAASRTCQTFRRQDRFPACGPCPSRPHCGGGCRCL